MTKKYQKIYTALIALLALVSWVTWTLPDSFLHVYFLNIGQGDAIFIRTPANQTVLIDGGPGSKILEELPKVMPFYEHSIDLLILTHPHKDHVEGLVEVLKRYNVKKVLFTGVQLEDPLYTEFLSEISIQEIPFQFADSNHDFDLGGGLYFDIIYPFNSLAGQQFKELNNTSIVFKLLYGQETILFTGDIEKETEAEIIKNVSILTANHLKLAHHGSKSSSTPEFIERVNPHSVYIQSEIYNKFNHPSPETMETIEDAGIYSIYRNDYQGRIELISDGIKTEMITEKTAPITQYSGQKLTPIPDSLGLN